MEQQLDWNDHNLLRCFAMESYEGFGFQVSDKPIDNCLYLAQIFVYDPNVHQSVLIGTYKEFGTEDVQIIHNKLPPTINPNDVWVTDYLGNDFLTIKIHQYNNIPIIINTCLNAGYKILTHTCFKAEFIPGDVFNRITFEQKLIESVFANYNTLFRPGDNIYGNQKTVWNSLARLSKIRPFTLHWNYATQEGRDFCSKLRIELDKKPYSTSKPRMLDLKYQEMCTKYGILHSAGWAVYNPHVSNNQSSLTQPQPQQPQPPQPQQQQPKIIKIENNDEMCMICLEKPPTTLVLPCGHKVVCDDCSKALRKTNDNKICCQCRCKIEFVSYSDNTFEEKV